jgi:uncharacterized protein (TIGR00645 family)
MMDPTRKFLQRALLASRWLLVPFYFVLFIGLGVLLYESGVHLWHMLSHMDSQDESQITVSLLKLVDLTLLASLIVIVIVSGFENFIARIRGEDASDVPVWMSQIDFSGLKLKLLATIAAIAAIQLLEVFMDIEGNKDRDILWHVVALLTFAVAGLIMAITDYISDRHPHEPKD